jgi:two-component system, NarL family, sensor histidine kinase DevS
VLSSELSLPQVLQRIVELAVRLTDCTYGALGVIGPTGKGLVEFVHTGLSDEERRRIGDPPKGHGVLGALISDARPLRLEDLSKDPRSVGFPKHHPPMRSFLGAPVVARGRVFGNVYLTEKRGGGAFTAQDERTLVTLAAQAGVAVANAQVHGDLQWHQQWLEALRAITASILAGSPTKDVLLRIAENARTLIGADLAAIVGPGTGGVLEIVAAVGPTAEALGELTVPREASISGTVLRTGEPFVSDDARADRNAYRPMVELGRIGPAIFVPLTARSEAFGTLVVANEPGRPTFREEELRMVQALADQAAVALEYGRAQRDLRLLAVLEDRERIARELHDGAIQDLFAAGMGLQFAADRIQDPDVRARLEKIATTIDGVIVDLRNYIRGLRPTILAMSTLEPAIHRLTDDLEMATGMTVVADVDPSAAALAEPYSGDIVQIVREALSNVRHHARAATCRVTLRADSDGIVLEIDDDGAGLPVSRRDGGNGLRNMERRVADLGGTFRVESAVGRGTTIALRLPAAGREEIATPS